MKSKKIAPEMGQLGSRSYKDNNRFYSIKAYHTCQAEIRKFNRTYSASEWLTEILVKLKLAEYADGGFDNVL